MGEIRVVCGGVPNLVSFSRDVVLALTGSPDHEQMTGTITFTHDAEPEEDGDSVKYAQCGREILPNHVREVQHICKPCVARLAGTEPEGDAVEDALSELRNLAEQLRQDAWREESSPMLTHSTNVQKKVAAARAQRTKECAELEELRERIGQAEPYEGLYHGVCEARDALADELARLREECDECRRKWEAGLAEAARTQAEAESENERLREERKGGRVVEVSIEHDPSRDDLTRRVVLHEPGRSDPWAFDLSEEGVRTLVGTNEPGLKYVATIHRVEEKAKVDVENSPDAEPEPGGDGPPHGFLGRGPTLDVAPERDAIGDTAVAMEDFIDRVRTRKWMCCLCHKRNTGEAGEMCHFVCDSCYNQAKEREGERVVEAFSYLGMGGSWRVEVPGPGTYAIRRVEPKAKAKVVSLLRCGRCMNTIERGAKRCSHCERPLDWSDLPEGDNGG